MDLKQQILHLYRVDELSLREIARRTGADHFGGEWIQFGSPGFPDWKAVLEYLDA